MFTAENATLDIHVAGSPLNTPRCMVYSDLILAKPGYLDQPGYTEYLPELAESWEVSPDKLTLTFKLHDGVKWHNKAPVNGRTLDVDDLKMTWERFVKQGRIRTTLANSVNPNAPDPVVDGAGRQDGGDQGQRADRRPVRRADAALTPACPASSRKRPTRPSTSAAT